MKQQKKWQLSVLMLLSSLFFVLTCSSALAATPAGQGLKIAIISDPHLYDSRLGTTGSAFEKYLESQDFKMEVESEAILQSAIDRIIKSDAQVVLVPGDMTNNGEYVNHMRMTSYLDKLVKAGKQVVVIDGNHDILNPDAASYAGDTRTRVRSITPEEFKNSYHAFGYSEAVAKDTNSLSYVVELAADVRLIVIDSCKYDVSNTKHVTAGEVAGERLTWVKMQIADAKSQGKTVLGMMHHGIVPHFSTERRMFPGFVVNNYDVLQREFSSLGLQVMFTGHFHSQDLAGQYFSENQYMLEIETGSLLNYPVPIRFVELTADRKQLHITSEKVKDVDYELQGAADFTEYALKNMPRGLKAMFLQQVTGVLIKDGCNWDEATQKAEKLADTEVAPGVTVSDLFVIAATAHYQGDENINPATKALIQNVAGSKEHITKLVGENMLAMVTDVPPADNNVTIDLRTGRAVLNHK